MKINESQGTPEENNNEPVWNLVIKDMKERKEIGKKKYGVDLQPYNGRSFLIDAYQEALDLAVYLRGLIYEEFGE